MTRQSWNSTNRFDRIASQWDSNPRRAAMAADIAHAIIETAKPLGTTTVLEFGCGTGLLTLALAPVVGSITAIDTSEKMIAVLQDKISTAGIDNVATRCTDPMAFREHLPEKTGFGLICSSMTLHHIADTEALFRHLFTLLAPGGSLAIADLDCEEGFFHDDPTLEVHHGFERSALQASLAGIGFRDMTFRTVHEIRKTNRAGETALYPVFLCIARKP